MTFDPIVHASLVVIFTWLINLLFSLIGIDLGGETATGLATVLVGYILSLFGYSAYKGLFNRNKVIGENVPNYKPPFTG